MTTPIRTCSRCGCTAENLIEFRDRLLCPDCLDSMTDVCVDCGTRFWHREGITIAKANGVYKGRKPIQPPELEKVMTRWQRREITAAEAMRQMGMSKSTFYRRVKGRCPLP